MCRCVLRTAAAGIKLKSGYIPGGHAHFGEILRHAVMVHKAASEGFKDVLIQIIGCIWDCWAAANEVVGDFE